MASHSCQRQYGQYNRHVDENMQRKSIRPHKMHRLSLGSCSHSAVNSYSNRNYLTSMSGKLTIKTVNLNIITEYNARQFTIKAGEDVTLTVSDTGIGMKEETQTKIFEPFYSTKEIGKGAGLGLSTVYGIIKQSGGFIEVRRKLEGVLRS